MRKAGDACSCDKGADPEVFQTIWKHLKTDGMPDQAANQLTAEMLTHGEDLDSSIEQYERILVTSKKKGLMSTRLKQWRWKVSRVVKTLVKVLGLPASILDK